MSYFQQNIGKKLLARHKQIAKNEALKSLSNARDIGVVYDVAKTESRELIKVVNYFESAGKNVITIGYVNSKELGEYAPNYKEVFFCNKDLNFWKLPKKESVKRFVTKDFDFLINLDCEGQLELQVISTFSVAKTRVGKHIEEFAFAQDFMIKTAAESAEDLFDEIKKYIK
ncbi:hypothetical protein N9I68_03855 [Bacteroidia bacterium]|nr:hypothetical protein [Bacteroidia bacterium]